MSIATPAIPEIIQPQIPEIQLTPQDIKILNDMEPILTEFKRTWFVETFLHRPEKTVFLVTGNQAGKNAMVAYSLVLRLYGWHPVEWKNMRPHVKIRTFRLASGSLPFDKNDDGSDKNTIYPALKKWLPKYLIVSDVTTRKSTLVVRDPQGGPNVTFEFVSYNQEVKTTQTGVQRFCYWEDEDAPKTFHEEQIPRLYKTQEQGYGGDIIMTLTPAEHLGWQFEDIFEQASIYIRTKRYLAFYKKHYKRDLPQEETTDRNTSIAVLQCATDDNLTMPKIPQHCDSEICLEKEKRSIKPVFIKTDIQDQWGFRPYKCEECGRLQYGPIDDGCRKFNDLDIIAIRRYGIFKQVSGAIFKQYDTRIHLIDPNIYFPHGIPHDWKHARAIDYHPLIKWAVTWAAISPRDEVFVYNEFNPDPRILITLEISKIIIDMSLDYVYYLNLIDPLSNVIQPNTGYSTLDDLNRIFNEYQLQKHGTGGYWVSWDTKSARGRDEIMKRLANSRLVGKPFCNQVDGKYLPTLWIFNNCHNMSYSLKSWKEKAWANREMLVNNDEKGKPEGKNSHFPMCLEGLFKHNGFSHLQYHERVLPPRKPSHQDHLSKLRGR